jgi:glycerate kinase
VLVVAAPDRFRGTAGAGEVAAAIATAAEAAGATCDRAPVAGGGEGTLEVLGGAVRTATVRGPLGDPVAAEWRLQPDGTAVVEMARASGLALVGGPGGNDPLRASTAGTGELIAAALDAGVEVVVACDVETLFVDAAEVFAPEKGATPAQVALLRRRLERLAQVYERDYGVDVTDLPGSGAAGGLAGGLAAAGAALVPGFDVVADALGLAERIAGADLVVTGEGTVDAESFEGKAVGGVVDLAIEAGVPVLVIAGEVLADELPDLPATVTIVSLVARFGRERALADTAGCVAEVVDSAVRDRAR